jgi:hypothetical protein
MQVCVGPLSCDIQRVLRYYNCNSGDHFNQALHELKSTWEKRECEAFSSVVLYVPNFFSWFMQYKSSEFKESTLRPLREELGLGSPPLPYYTNDSESINAAIKDEVN